MMKRKSKIVILIMAALIVIVALFITWYFTPKTFLKNIESTDVKDISVFDGNTGKSFKINDPEEIAYIVENIQGIEMKRDNISVNYIGYSFRMSFYGENETALESFYMNSDDTIRSDPFFYRCDDGLCYDYLKELEGKYIK